MKTSRLVAILLVFVLAILACGSQAPEYVLRGWTPTPSLTPPPSETPTPIFSPTPIVITPTYTPYTLTVGADHLTVRSGPGSNYNGSPTWYLARGDVIQVLDCVIGHDGEAWILFHSSARKLTGWAAVTYRGRIFMDLPRSCSMGE